MSRIVRFGQFLPIERSKFLSALERAALDPARFDVSRMEITPPLMPGSVTGLVTVKLAASAIAFSYEDAAGRSWVGAFEDDLAAGHFGGSASRSRSRVQASHEALAQDGADTGRFKLER